MPKVQYKQLFPDAWMAKDKFKKWLRKVQRDSTKVYCCYCKATVAAKIFDIRQHAATKKHVSAVGSVQTNKTDLKKKSLKTEEQEAALCMYIAEHSAIAPIDHLSTLCASKFKACTAAAQIKLRRTKCTQIINNVLAVHFNEYLRHDIGSSKFSLLLDESSDISVTKLLGKLKFTLH